jgi:hypothetical protein
VHLYLLVRGEVERCQEHVRRQASVRHGKPRGRLAAINDPRP